MPGWSEILNDINKSQNPANELNNRRKEYFDKITAITDRNVIAYYSAWLKQPIPPNTSINDQDMNAFMATVHKLDKSKGLDLILHTQGGNIAATEGIVNYLKSLFHNDIRAFIPQISMSAGTMIAMSCKEIIMGKQSSLGPIDPQLGGIACQAAIDEFERAVNEISNNPASLGLWQVIISKFNPTFLTTCDNAIKWSGELADKWLKEVNPNINLRTVKDLFLNHKNSHSHDRHISRQECKRVGLNVRDLEDNQELQDAVLSLHHCYMILFDTFGISKIVENHIGGRYIIKYEQQNKMK